MIYDLTTIGGLIVTAVVGIILGATIFIKLNKKSQQNYEKKAEEVIKKAEKQAEEIKEKITEKKQNIINAVEESKKRQEEQFKRIEKIIEAKEKQIATKEEQLKKEENKVKSIQGEVNKLKEVNETIKNNIKKELQTKTGLTEERAKQEVLETLRADLELMKTERLNFYLEKLEEEKKKIAKNMLTEVIQRYKDPTSVEKKDMTITLQRDEQKAKLIGQNAEILLHIQETTGCELIFNDAPKTIIVSSYDLYKKYIANQLIKKLLKERVITKEKITNFFKQVEEETKLKLVSSGKKILKKVNIEGEYPDEFYQMVGRLQFRTSYGQNILKHSYEVGYFTLMLGGELGLNINTCKIGGFLHDLGKSIDKEVGEPHDILTKQIMEKYGFSKEEVHAAWTHHDAIPIETPEAMLVKAGDAISAGRPGARQETLEKYIARIKAIEEIGNSYEGVKKAFAISAGRELRVLVEPKTIKDKYLPELAKTVAEEIEENVGYPGKIKVNVIRRTTNTVTIKSKS